MRNYLRKVSSTNPPVSSYLLHTKSSLLPKTSPTSHTYRPRSSTRGTFVIRNIMASTEGWGITTPTEDWDIIASTEDWGWGYEESTALVPARTDATTKASTKASTKAHR